ncbi:ABC transporter ATP-binding protein [Lacrimispora brassicae]
MGAIQLKDVTKKFGNDVVIHNLNLEIEDGSFTVLVGPSGCGKSTTLRMITGLDEPTSGDIFIDSQKINDLTPGKRDIAMVFQNYALYPTMTVKENIEFGLENKRVPKEERQKRVKDICEIVGLTEYLDRKPSTLSGGQRQRVALARAMVKQPKVFLMDEPLSNLDAKLRGQMRVELISLHKKLGTTFVYVTHDQVEAMSMADDIVLMKDGYIVQQSNPRELYQNPNCIYAAQFIGTPQMNIINNVLPDGMQLGFRPEKLYLQKVEEDHITIQAEVVTKEMLGAETIYSLKSTYGVLMAKSQYEVDDDSCLSLWVPFSDMYLFNNQGCRMALGEAEKPMIRKTFGREEG